MADLRALFADLGFTGVATLLNSGNVVFTAGKVACRTHTTPEATEALSTPKSPVAIRSNMAMTPSTGFRSSPT